MASKEFSTSQLLDPTINLKLGTINLKQAIDRYGGQVEYALAAYNAGDTPVRQWLASNDYKDVSEFVESTPTPRRASTFRPSCATVKCIARCTPLDRAFLELV